MKAFFQVIRYIYKNNPWYRFLDRLFQAVLYQCYKRATKGVFTKTLFNGKKIFLYPYSPISSAFVYTSCPDKEEISLLRQFANQNTIFIDVGANVGTYSVLLLDKVKTVYAFEAHPVTANFCKMNFLLNNISETHVISKAVSHNCEPKFFSNLENASPTNARLTDDKNAIAVQATTLDTFFQEQQFDKATQFIVKIDVEGFEHEVFEGAKTLIASKAVKAIIFETFSSKNAEIVSLLQTLGYTLQGLSENNMLAYRS